MNEYEKMVPVELRMIVEGAIGEARKNIGKVKQLAMVAFVGRLDDFECAILLLEGLGTKQNAADALAKFARAKDADFILHICEMHMLRTDAKTEAEAREIQRHADKVGVSNMPGNVEGVCFQVETGAGMFLAFCEIEQVDGRRTFGPAEFEYKPGYRGRFANILPKDKR